MQQLKAVLTGGPSSGKTTLINQLNLSGIRCFEEVSREIISMAQSKGGDIPFISHPLAFSEALFERRLQDYFTPSGDRTHLFDRGIHDVVAYLNRIGKEIPCGMQEDCIKYTYEKVFVLPPWEAIFEKDKERIEDFEESVILHKALVDTYEDFGMTCIEVPKLSIEERKAFIVKHL